MTWKMIAGGTTIGGEGSDNGTILRDEEFCQRARITLEKDSKTAPFSITCGIYGWMFHARGFSSLPEASEQYEQMKAALSGILAHPADGPSDAAEHASFAAAIAEYVRRFP